LTMYSFDHLAGTSQKCTGRKTPVFARRQQRDNQWVLALSTPLPKRSEKVEGATPHMPSSK
jgi:hypothetical protein